MKRWIRSALQSIPHVRQLREERDQLREQLRLIRPGHFYSVIPSIDDVRRDANKLFDRSEREIPGVDLNVPGQLQLLEELAKFYAEMPFTDEPSPGLRYHFINDYYLHADAIYLYSMIRWARPKRIIEIGSGFTSFVMLDTNERFFDWAIQLTFIEPNVKRLLSRLRPGDAERAEIIPSVAQQVDLNRFAQLQANDILFIDSSHVSKIGSDVNHIFFEILPRLAPGVLVHVHDVFYPFEYLQEWFERGWYWNEAYLLRAFLQFNSTFEVRIWNQYLARFHGERVRELMPLCMKNTGGAMWMQRV